MQDRETLGHVRRGLIASIAIATMFLSLAMVSALAGAVPRSTTRTFLVGTDPLCTILPDVPPEFACPAAAMADNGDTIWISGAGAFNPSTKAASGGGTFTHKNAAGAVLGSGTWTAVTPLGFKSYGTAVIAGMLLEGGLVLLRVHLVAGGGAVQLDAIMWIDCLVGPNVPAGAEEGIRLAIQDIDLNFNKEVQGLTVFIPA